MITTHDIQWHVISPPDISMPCRGRLSSALLFQIFPTFQCEFYAGDPSTNNGSFIAVIRCGSDIASKWNNHSVKIGLLTHLVASRPYLGLEPDASLMCPSTHTPIMQEFIDKQDELSCLEFMRKYGMPERINTEVFISMAKALDFIDPDKLSMVVVLTAMNRFLNETDGLQMAFLDGNQPDRLCAVEKVSLTHPLSSAPCIKIGMAQKSTCMPCRRHSTLRNNSASAKWER